MRRRTTLASTVAIATLLLAGCSSGTSTSSPTTPAASSTMASDTTSQSPTDAMSQSPTGSTTAGDLTPVAVPGYTYGTTTSQMQRLCTVITQSASQIYTGCAIHVVDGGDGKMQLVQFAISDQVSQTLQTSTVLQTIAQAAGGANGRVQKIGGKTVVTAGSTADAGIYVWAQGNQLLMVQSEKNATGRSFTEAYINAAG